MGWDPIVYHICNMAVVDALRKRGRSTKPSGPSGRPGLNCLGASLSIHVSNIKGSADEVCECGSIVDGLAEDDTAVERRRKYMMVDDTKRKVLQR